MAVRSWLRRLFAPRTQGNVRNAPAGWRPSVESLEAREVPAAPVITSHWVSPTAVEGDAFNANKIQFNASAIDPDGGAVTYKWTITKPNGDPAGSCAEASGSYSPPDSGTYRVALTVIDDEGEFAVAVPEAGSPTGWWGGEGTANDYMNQNHGSIGGGVAYATGKVGLAFNFAGTGRVTVPDSVSLDQTTAVTMEAWVKPSALTFNNNFGTVIAKSDNTVRNYGLFVRSNGALHLSYINATGTNVILETVANQIAAGQYRHVAATIDTAAGWMRIYMDGKEVKSGQTAGPMAANDAPVTIGNADSAYNYGFKGVIDEPAVYNQALTAAEVRSNYTIGSTNGVGASKFSHTVQVANAAPIVRWTDAPISGEVGKGITFRIRAGDLSPEDLSGVNGFQVTFDWGDGLPVSQSTWKRSPTSLINSGPNMAGYTDIVDYHTYKYAGTYTIKVTVQDKDGGTTVLTHTITIA